MDGFFPGVPPLRVKFSSFGAYSPGCTVLKTLDLTLMTACLALRSSSSSVYIFVPEFIINLVALFLGIGALSYGLHNIRPTPSELALRG